VAVGTTTAEGELLRLVHQNNSANEPTSTTALASASRNALAFRRGAWLGRLGDVSGVSGGPGRTLT
jgi:hypothetical protein